MISLCEAVRPHLTSVLSAYDSTDYVISAEGQDACTVRISDLQVNFYRDQRDKGVTSTLTFMDAGADDREQLDTHVIARLFRDLRSNESKVQESGAEKVSTEVENVAQVVRKIKEMNLSPRDLIYFCLGYNSAYTDYYSDKMP